MSLIRRVLFVAWQNPETRRFYPVARLLNRETSPRWEFAYIRGARDAALTGFVPFHGFGEFDDLTVSEELPPFFANRLMRKSRPDFGAFMQRLGFPAQGEAEIPVLARSEGLRASEMIEFYGLPTFDSVRDRYRFLFFLRGVRHVAEAEACIARLHVGDPLDLVPDAKNPFDPLAIRVHEGQGQKIGWMPATLVEDLHELRKHGSEFAVTVDRVNPHPGPVQTRVLCRLEATNVTGFTPLATPRYEPIPADATPIHVVPEELVA